MSAQSVLTALALPPVSLFVLAILGGLAAWRGRRRGGVVAAAAALGALLLATPMVESWLRGPLEQAAIAAPPGGDATAPGAIIVLGAEMARGLDGPDVGPLTLERLRAGAALHRRTGLPLLVTGGPLSPGAPPIGALMANSLGADFGVPVRWVEECAPDTRGNASGSVALLRAEGIGAAYLVTHAWHLPRSREAFARLGFPVVAAPVRVSPRPDGRASDWLPRPDHLGGSWFALREWLGGLVYRVRDG